MQGVADPPTIESRTSMDTDTWARLHEWASTGRVLGLLLASAPSLLRLSEDQQVQLKESAMASVANSLLIESSLGAAATALDDAGIEWRVLKGCATSHLLYPEPGLRTLGDVDILVRPHDLFEALIALEPLATSTGKIPRGRARAAGDQECLVVDARGVEIDLHQAVQPWTIASRLPTDALFEHRQDLTRRGPQGLDDVGRGPSRARGGAHGRKLRTDVDGGRHRSASPAVLACRSSIGSNPRHFWRSSTLRMGPPACERFHSASGRMGVVC